MVIYVRDCGNTDEHGVPLVYCLQLHPGLKTMWRSLQEKRYNQHVFVYLYRLSLVVTVILHNANCYRQHYLIINIFT